ncbi:YbjQ family protein [Leuconostoc citreum]|uniref:YbjQ family protein n=1 Tax=Leuconostoc citreum TaxID=33964 RepID=UPI0021A97658|nr:heavy metal-binding domain-containing protein [Leuconostoc citreum]
MKIVTTEMFSNKDIVEVKEAVFSEQVLSVNIVKDAISGIKGILGGKSNSYSEEFSKGRELALVALKSQAALLSANIIIDVCVDYNQFVNSDHGKIGLVLAAKDKNVDSVETKNVYSKVIDAKQLRIKTIPNVEHRMINPDIANSDFLINLVGVILPKYYLIDKNYLDYCETFVSQLSS